MSTPEDVASDFVINRCAEIQTELNRVGVTFRSAEVFEAPKAEDDCVQVRPVRGGRVGIVVASDVPGLLNGQVVLDVSETYSYADLKSDLKKPLRLVKYGYQFSYMPELVIESKTLFAASRGHWGDLLLTQRRQYRFDGEDATEWKGKGQEYCNSHFVDHFHLGSEDPMRLPVQTRPTVLTVACFVLFSFQYAKWLRYAKADAEVLKATRLFLPHVQA